MMIGIHTEGRNRFLQHLESVTLLRKEASKARETFGSKGPQHMPPCSSKTSYEGN